MKKKILTISIVLFILFLIVAIVCFFLMKNAESEHKDETQEQYDTSSIVEDIEFLKFNTFEEIKKYADDYPIYIQTSDDSTVFGIGELYVEDNPVTIIYKLNEDGSINRFDGTYSINLSEKSAQSAERMIWLFDAVIVDYFNVQRFEHNIYDENGMPIDQNSKESYELFYQGKAKYSLSIIDEENTYWYISAVVKEEKQIDFKFFRCFDLSVYNDNSPNIDLRISEEETGE